MHRAVFGSPVSTRIVWLAADGSLRITIPCEPLLPGESETMYLDRIALAAQTADPGLQECSRAADVDAAVLPASRRFRACWRFAAGTVQVHPPAARQQRLDEIRAERNRRLLESDAERARLDEIGTSQQRAALTAYRQQLRDLPALVSVELVTLTTAEELASYQPAWPTPPQG